MNSSIKILSTSIRILVGPCSHTLFDACKYAYDQNIRPDRIAWFGIKDDDPKETDPFKLWVRIISIEHEDGSGKSFNLKGYVSTSCEKLAYRGKRFEAYYNAGSTRHGEIRIFN